MRVGGGVDAGVVLVAEGEVGGEGEGAAGVALGVSAR